MTVYTDRIAALLAELTRPQQRRTSSAGERARSPRWSPRDSPTARSPDGCSSPSGRHRTTCNTSSPSSDSRGARRSRHGVLTSTMSSRDESSGGFADRRPSVPFSLHGIQPRTRRTTDEVDDHRNPSVRLDRDVREGSRHVGIPPAWRSATSAPPKTAPCESSTSGSRRHTRIASSPRSSAQRSPRCSAPSPVVFPRSSASRSLASDAADPSPQPERTPSRPGCSQVRTPGRWRAVSARR